MSIGPALPPGFKRSSTGSDDAVGPQPKRRVGPSVEALVKDEAEIPLDDEAPAAQPARAAGPTLAALVRDEAEINLADDDSAPGPQPLSAPSLANAKPAPAPAPAPKATPAKRSYGPSLRDLVKDDTKEEEAAPMPAVAPAAALAKPQASSAPVEDNDDFVGPLPPHLLAARGLQPRAAAPTKDGEAAEWAAVRDGKKEEKVTKRAEWMTSLPADRTSVFAIGNRTFDKKDRDHAVDSSWTETPQDRKRKLEEAGKAKPAAAAGPAADPIQQKKQEHMAKLVSEYNAANRPKSLMEQHAEAKAAKPGATADRPFDREKDMAQRRPLTQREKDAMMNDAKGLNSRFAKNSSLHFLEVPAPPCVGSSTDGRGPDKAAFSATRAHLLRLHTFFSIVGTYCALSCVYEWWDTNRQRQNFKRKLAELRDDSYELCRMKLARRRKAEGKPPLPADVTLNPPDYIELERMHDIGVIDIRLEHDNSFHCIIQPWKVRHWLRFSFLEVVRDDSRPDKYEGKVAGKVDAEASSLGRQALALKHAIYSPENLKEEPIMVDVLQPPKWKLHWRLFTTGSEIT